MPALICPSPETSLQLHKIRGKSGAESAEFLSKAEEKMKGAYPWSFTDEVKGAFQLFDQDTKG